MKQKLPSLNSSSLWLLETSGEEEMASVKAWLPLHLAKAVAKRQQQSLAARWCAREAAQEVGIELLSLPADGKGVPLWPSTLVGSLSHTEKRAVALVANSSVYQSVGVDVEEIIADSKVAELAASVLTRNEMKLMPVDQPGLWFTRVFSLKEAFYKAVYPWEKRFIDFLEVEVSVSSDGSFMCHPSTFKTPKPAQISEFISQDFVVTAIYL